MILPNETEPGFFSQNIFSEPCQVDLFAWT